MYLIPLYFFFFGFYICNNKGKVVWGNSNLSNANELSEHLSHKKRGGNVFFCYAVWVNLVV
jgi:hypothetical protein